MTKSLSSISESWAEWYRSGLTDYIKCKLTTFQNIIMKSEYLIRINYSVENLHRKHKFWVYVPSHDKSEHVSILRNCFAKQWNACLTILTLYLHLHLFNVTKVRFLIRILLLDHIYWFINVYITAMLQVASPPAITLMKYIRVSVFIYVGDPKSKVSKSMVT